jgi:endoglucanase
MRPRRPAQCYERRDRAPANCVVAIVAGVTLLAIGLALTLARVPVAAAGQDATRRCAATGPTGVPPQRVAMLRRGFNLTGWLDGETVRRPDERVLADLYARGLTHIRLPVTAERLMDDFAGEVEAAGRLAELDRAIARLTALGFGVSLDLHPGGKLSRFHVADPPRAVMLIEALWRRLARRYVHVPDDRLLFELLNEPAVDARTWNAQAARLIAVLREEAPGRTLIYGPANFQRIDALLDVQPFPDTNVVYAVHFYDPMIFTHQGLDWSDDPLRDLSGVPFPASLTDARVRQLRGRLTDPAARRLIDDALAAPWTEGRIEREFARAGAWAAQHRRPVILNEFGVLGWKAPRADRLRWLATVRAAAERHCIGWTHWDYADGFGFVRRVGLQESPDEGVLLALLGAAAARR